MNAVHLLSEDERGRGKGKKETFPDFYLAFPDTYLVIGSTLKVYFG